MTVTEYYPSIRDIIQGYEDREQHLSYSAIKAFMQSPKHFIEYKTKVREQTPAMEFGTAFHMAVLEPELFEKTYEVAPDVDRRTKDGKLEWSIFCDRVEREGKKVLTHSDMASIKHMQQSINRNKPARWVLDQITERELPQRWDYGGFKWKGFLDGRGPGLILDLKTIADANPDKAYREMIYKMFYHVQGFLYQIPNPEHDYYIIFVDKPGHVTTVKLRETTLLAAKEKLDYSIKAFKRCLFLNQWDKSYDFYAPREGAGIYSF